MKHAKNNDKSQVFYPRYFIACCMRKLLFNRGSTHIIEVQIEVLLSFIAGT